MTTLLKPGALLSLFGIPVTALASVIHVPLDQPSIQAGIAAASRGDTVLVAPGTYRENINFRGKNIVLASRYLESRDTADISSTIIDGSAPADADSASTVLIVSGEDSSAVLEGFTITGGTGTNWTDEHGAGVYREGGGILVEQSSPTIEHNLIVGNAVSLSAKVVSAGGGGIRAGDGNPRILHNVVSSNTGRYGAGIVLNYTGAILQNNILTKNAGGQDYGGGALWMNHDGATSKTILNTTIAGNHVLAVYVWQGSSVIRNCIIIGDTSTTALQIGVRSGGPAVAYSCVQGGWSGTGNIAGDPKFSDGLYHLDGASPCVDAGDTAALYNDRGNPSTPGGALWPSQGGLRNDMGAYGGPGAAAFPAFTPLTSVASPIPSVPTSTMLEPVYPNPFNPSTTVRYRLASAGEVSLRVFDLLGREVALIADGVEQAGEYRRVFSGSGLASGVYYCRLKVKSSDGAITVQTERMLMLK